MADQPDTDSAEVWKDVLDWEGLYQVSSLGRARSLDRCSIFDTVAGPQQRMVRGKLLKLTPIQGYLCIGLTDMPRRVLRRVHQLVCEAFHGAKPFPGAEVAHWDGNKANNVPSNLRWATQVENSADKIRHGKTVRGERNGRAKLTAEQVREIRRRYVPNQHGQRVPLANEFGVTAETIDKIVKRAKWKHVQ